MSWSVLRDLSDNRQAEALAQKARLEQEILSLEKSHREKIDEINQVHIEILTVEQSYFSKGSVSKKELDILKAKIQKLTHKKLELIDERNQLSDKISQQKEALEDLKAEIIEISRKKEKYQHLLSQEKLAKAQEDEKKEDAEMEELAHCRSRG